MSLLQQLLNPPTLRSSQWMLYSVLQESRQVDCSPPYSVFLCGLRLQHLVVEEQQTLKNSISKLQNIWGNNFGMILRILLSVISENVEGIYRKVYGSLRKYFFKKNCQFLESQGAARACLTAARPCLT